MASAPGSGRALTVFAAALGAAASAFRLIGEASRYDPDDLASVITQVHLEVSYAAFVASVVTLLARWMGRRLLHVSYRRGTDRLLWLLLAYAICLLLGSTVTAQFNWTFQIRTLAPRTG